MPLIAGIDPGTGGALAVYDTDTRTVVSVEDMPVWWELVGKKKRKRLDFVAVMELFEGLNMIGVELVVMEAVGGRPRQSASAAFVFGYTVGLIMAAAMYSKIMVHTVPPTRWKKALSVPGKAGGGDSAAKKAAQGSIMKRADELFPHDRDKFRTERNAYRMDRAEAAMLAKFGGDVVLATLPAISDVELKMAYRNADTGA
jgi:Holliday junction resolvasome RuvABC endonuclease subunit